MPARVSRAAHAWRGLTGRRWTILEGGNRGGVLTWVSSVDALWGLERWCCHVRRGCGLQTQA